MDGFNRLLSVFFRLAILVDIIVILADRKDLGKYEEAIYIYIDWIILWVFLLEISVKVTVYYFFTNLHYF